MVDRGQPCIKRSTKRLGFPMIGVWRVMVEPGGACILYSERILVTAMDKELNEVPHSVVRNRKVEGEHQID